MAGAAEYGPEHRFDPAGIPQGWRQRGCRGPRRLLRGQRSPHDRDCGRMPSPPPVGRRDLQLHSGHANYWRHLPVYARERAGGDRPSHPRHGVQPAQDHHGLGLPAHDAQAVQDRLPGDMQYVLNQGSDARVTLRIKYPGASVEAPPDTPAIQTLTDLARTEPSYRKVLAMPFAYYVIWTYAFTPRWWLKGFSAEEQDKEYREIYAFVAHLLKTYNGTGKTFFLG